MHLEQGIFLSVKELFSQYWAHRQSGFSASPIKWSSDQRDKLIKFMDADQ
jgi:hypothetical protein